MKNKTRVALVYDRINTPYGGAEKLLLTLHHIFPTAPVYTSVYDPVQAPWAKKDKIEVRTSFLQRAPFSVLAKKHHRMFAPLMPLAFELLDLSNFDLIISITSAEAKGIITQAHQLHVCYLLSPSRYLWSHRQMYEKAYAKSSFLNWLVKVLSKPFIKYLQWWDRVAAMRPDVIIPISHLTQKRCAEFYDRKTETPIYPIVVDRSVQVKGLSVANVTDQKEWSLAEQSITNIKEFILTQEPFYLMVTRLVPYKRVDLAIQACQQLGRRLVIVGDGPDRTRLEKLVFQQEPAIIFLKNQPEEVVRVLYNTCQAVIMPGEEDFGLTALEAWANGVPVILNHRSGVYELLDNASVKKVCQPVQGEHLHSLLQAITDFEQKTWHPNSIARWAQKYDTLTFQSEFKNKIDNLWNVFQKRAK